MLYIFDKDNTLVTKRGGGDPPIPNHVDEQVALPGVVEKCAELRAQGHVLAVASNQGGVAWGFLTNEDADALMRHAADLIGAQTWQHCPHHPKAKSLTLGRECLCRKPQPGMLLAIMVRLNFDADDTIYIGDMDTDKQAAEAAGVQFVWAKDFFEWKED
jgi:D-glycero-D-manno-heptose 1,7-bisphosphate phosphatase